MDRCPYYKEAYVLPERKVVGCEACDEAVIDVTEERCYCQEDGREDKNGGKRCGGNKKKGRKSVREKCLGKCFRLCLLACVIIGYAFAGSVIFLATEENVSSLQLTSALVSDRLIPFTNESAYAWFLKLGRESREEALRNIWQITVNLNILYRHNWTVLAAEELVNFQERLLDRLWREKTFLEAAVNSQDAQKVSEHPPTHWKLGKAFLYAISILSTVGFGNSLGRSSNNKLTTMLYALAGLPLMFMYLCNMGGLLSICAKHVFTRSLCCCLCSKCGYCCYDEKLMREKERRMRKKREQCKMAVAMDQSSYFLKSSPGSNEDSSTNSVDSKTHNECSRFLAPLMVCMVSTCAYIATGSIILVKIDQNWTILDSVYFCFMLVTTVGIADIPFDSALSPNAQYTNPRDSFLVWFFSAYIFLGLGFAAMCFNVIQDGAKRKMNEFYPCEITDKSKKSQSSMSLNKTEDIS